MRALFLLLASTTACGSSQLYQSAFDNAATVPNITSLEVYQDGNLMREAFYAGTDDTTAHDVRSLTKTVTALLVGAALDSGCITSIDQPIGTLLDDPALADAGKAAITVRNLLTMTSGLQWTEDGAVGDYNTWAAAADQVSFVLQRSIVAAPGTTFNYNSGAFHLLSAIISHACAPTATFADQRLFEPLGITTPAWETDAQGIPNGAAGLQLTTGELGQLGELIRNQGVYENVIGDVSVVSGDYVSMMTTAHSSTGDLQDETPSYGYGVWIGQPISGADFSLGEGYGGQFLFVIPDDNAVIVATSNWQGLGDDVANADYGQLYTILLTQLLGTI